MSVLFAILFLLSIGCFFMGLVKPTLFSGVFKENATRKKLSKYFGISTMVFFILIPMFVDESNVDENQKEQEISNQEPEISKKDQPLNNILNGQGGPVEYEIFKVENLSYKAIGKKNLSDYSLKELQELPLCKKMAYRIIVSPKIKENQVIPTIKKIISDITEKDNEIDEMFLHLYSDKTIANEAWEIAMVTWGENGEIGNVTPEIAKSNDRSNYKTNIEMKENLEEYLKNKKTSEIKLGFTEEKRKEIFKELVATESKAMEDADRIYPIDASKPNFKKENVLKNADKHTELMEKYKAEVRKKYKIDKNIEKQIVSEAFSKRWPMR